VPKPLGTLDGANAQDLVARFRTLREKIEKRRQLPGIFDNTGVQWLNISQN
jgi:hypothetical protein